MTTFTPPSRPTDRPRIGGGRYELLGLLGSGASGEVHRARDHRTGLEVAVKILRKADANEIYQLKREFRVLADVRHGGLARLHDLHIDDAQCFFTMELVEGEDLVRYLDGKNPAERAAAIAALLPQLVSAIRAVHALGIVHRDLKPENILLEAARPRLVLIDFGLLAPLLPDARDTASLAELAGTIAYMAPEQLWGRTITDAADWYALGGVLFHALFGAPAFAGSVGSVANAKATGAEPKVPKRDSDPTWLVSLIVDLLANDPADRPSGEQVEARVIAACSPTLEPAETLAIPPRRAGGWNARSDASESFFGREHELAVLRGAFDRSRGTGRTLVRVSGPSGIGKSELLQRFLTMVEKESHAVVLRGRCHPYEAIPRKGLDQVVDDLSRYLALDDFACASLGDDESFALCRLFPVLGRVARLTDRGNHGDAMDPQVVRQIGIDAFTSVLSTIASRRPLVLWIDDVQWSDDESAVALSRFLEVDRGARGLVLLSYRPEAEGVSAMVGLGNALAQDDGGSVTISVPPLDAGAARRLVNDLVGNGIELSPTDIDAVVTEAGGSPFFLSELVRSLRTSRGSGHAAAPVPRVEEVVALRYWNLPADTRGVMDVLAMAGAPLREETSVAASGESESWRGLAELERECLVRSIDTPQGRRVQPYHDRIAEGVRAQLDPQRRDAVHRDLIEVLEAETDTDHELLVFHCSAAMQMARAAFHAAPAARKAADTLAFDRAAELYRLAIEHGGQSQHVQPADDRHSLRVGLAESLANAGRGEEAAVAFEQAAGDGSGPAESDFASIDLRRRGAEQLLRCGRVEEGIARMRDVLAFFGERLPDSSGEAMRSFVWQRLRLLVRGTKIRPGSRVLDAPSAARLDAMWSTTVAVSMIDVGLAGAVQVRHFHEALDFADPDRLALALAHEATWRSCFGPRMRRSAADALLEARRLAGHHGRSYPDAWTSMADGIVRWQSAQFSQAVPCFDTALAGYRHGCRGVFFEIALTAMYQFASLALAGRVGRLTAMVEAETEGARRRHDRFAHHGCLMGEAVHRRLASDEPDRALAEADAAIAEWPTRDFLMPHYQYLLATVQADLYRGDASAAWTRLERAWGALRKAGYLWLECPSLGLTFLRARAALMVLDQSDQPRQRAAMLRVATGAERRIRRSSLPISAGFAATIRAGLQHATGDVRGAEAELRSAIGAYQIADMTMHAAACDRSLARLAAAVDESGSGRIAERWADEEGWRDLDRLADSLAPLPRA